MDVTPPPASDTRDLDLISLGEVMLRLDSGDRPVADARTFTVCEGGGEYNVARALAKNFGLRTSIVTALADNAAGRLVGSLIADADVRTADIIWRPTDGISRSARNGLYFMDRGFGVRQPAGCSDRANTAVSQLKAGDVGWEPIMRRTRWFHTGGIFAGLSYSTPEVAAEAMAAAREAGVTVSFDLNYRDSLWAERGGRDAADAVTAKLLPLADVVFGVPGLDARLSAFSEDAFRENASALRERFPNCRLVATTLRDVQNASRHSLGAAAFDGESVFVARPLRDLAVLDRVGSGDAFAAGVIVGSLENEGIARSLDLGIATAAFCLASAGDGVDATREQIEALADGSAGSMSR